MAKIQVQPQVPVNGQNTAATSAAEVAGAVVNTFEATSLYVGDLDLSVTDSQLYDLCSQVGPVISVRVCRDLATRRSLGYGYVNYGDSQDAARALDELNFTPLNNKPIRIMYSHRDPSIRKSGSGNIFIKNLDKAIDHKALHDTFSSFGNILSCKIATDASGQSKGHGFVQFDDEESAQKAIDKLNGMLINDKPVFVGHFLRKQERESSSNKDRFNNVYVKNLSESTTDEDLKKVFGEYGPITSAVVMRDGDGKSKGFGFVNFEDADDAAKAVEGLNGKEFDDKDWYVGKAQKKSERQGELKEQFEQSMKQADKLLGVNLYVKNLDGSISDEKLKDLFSEFGTVTSCKIMQDDNGVSKGSGFVAFSTSDEAFRALAEMNGKIVVSKPLYVAPAERKEERRARLQAQFAQMSPVAMAPAFGPRIPTYPPGAPGLGQQFLYGQAPQAVLPPQAGFGYQQQFIPRMRPGRAPVPNYFVPVVQQGQQGQYPVGQRGAGPVQQTQSEPLTQQRPLLSARVYRPPHMRGHIHHTPVFTSPSGDTYVEHPEGGMAPVKSVSYPISALASSLAAVPPEQKRMVLGECLYPLVSELEPGVAAKITGMLLEMDQTEILHLIDSPPALKAKVVEAMDVLRSVTTQLQNSPTEQLASLSLND